MSSEASGPRSAHRGAEETYELRRGHPSDSRVQKEAEAEVLRAASAYFGRELHPTDLATPSGLTVRVDGVSDDRSVLTDAFRLMRFRSFSHLHRRSPYAASPRTKPRAHWCGTNAASAGLAGPPMHSTT